MSMIVSYPRLRECVSGEIVIQLQDLLAKAGSNIQIDGKFGLGTRNAVRAFQKRYGLDVTGVVENDTWIKLLEVAGNIKIKEPIPEKKLIVTIPDLTEAQAKELMRKYPKASIS